MVTNPKRHQAIERIAQNISYRGHHVYVVSGDPNPRFAYTIGLSPRFGTELVLAGAITYMHDEVVQILNTIADAGRGREDLGRRSFEVPSLGTFVLGDVHESWSEMLLLGAFDFYNSKDIRALQIIPDREHWTIDVPDMSQPWSIERASAWQWLQQPWQYPIPETSAATTNLAALRGQQITEAARWEEDQWELFAGAGLDVSEEEMRVVPIGMLLAHDSSLLPVVSLPVEGALWRDEGSEWHPWVRRNE